MIDADRFNSNLIAVVVLRKGFCFKFNPSVWLLRMIHYSRSAYFYWHSKGKNGTSTARFDFKLAFEGFGDYSKITQVEEKFQMRLVNNCLGRRI